MKPTELYCHVLDYLTTKPGIVVRSSETLEVSRNTQSPFLYSSRILYEGEEEPAAYLNDLIAGLEGIVSIHEGYYNLILKRFSEKDEREIVFIERTTKSESRK